VEAAQQGAMSDDTCKVKFVDAVLLCSVISVVFNVLAALQNIVSLNASRNTLLYVMAPPSSSEQGRARVIMACAPIIFTRHPLTGGSGV
jgi:hypothetical protein